MTPSAALAETQDAAASSVQAQSQELDGALPQDQNAESPESAAPFASDLTASGSPDAAASDSEQSKTSDQLETAAASAQSQVAQASVSADENLANALSSDNGAAAQADTALSSSAKVYIQDAKDKDISYSTKSGALSAGDTLWANVYDEEDWEEYSVSNPGTWTYAWMAGTKNSASISDYTELVGQSQSLTITSDMAGKYFICKVTADGKDYYGPASYGSGVSADEIPGPVLSAGQAQLYKVTLSSSAPAVGDTLAATAYTSYSTQVTDDVNVFYTWSYSDSKYGTFAVIEGQNGSTFALTSEYQGKYIKVTASAGVNEQSATTSEAVLPAGAVKLAGVGLKASSTEIGATLTAKAYTGLSNSPTYVDDSKVTYTWKKYKGASAPSDSATWETIEGQDGSTLSVDDGLEGWYVTVSANAGANDVTYGGYYTGYVGPSNRPAPSISIALSLPLPAPNPVPTSIAWVAR